MKEELIRIENGYFQYEDGEYRFDAEISKGECIGIYTDEHLSSDEAYLGIFNGASVMKRGKAFVCGGRVRNDEMRRWILHNCMIVDKNRFITKELTVQDYIIALGKHKNDVPSLESGEMQYIWNNMKAGFSPEDKIGELSMLDYYKLSIFKAWFTQSRIVILDRMTEILRSQDLDEFMECVQLLQEQGTGVFLMDIDDSFLFRYANRIDVVKNREICYRLMPDEFNEKLYEILGWEYRDKCLAQNSIISSEQGSVILSMSELQFDSIPPISYQLRSGEIAFLRDENYNTASQIRDCFLGEIGWQSGFLNLDGNYYEWNQLHKLLGRKIGLQLEISDRNDTMLFENLTALDNLCSSLLPKAGMHICRKKIMQNVLEEASAWFEKDELLKKVSQWQKPEKIRLSYFKWYLLNPKLLVCLFPFAGQEPAYHEMIIQMLVTCAQRGMAVWIISSGIDAICRKTGNKEFLKRLRYINVNAQNN